VSIDKCIPRTAGGPRAQRVPRPKYDNGVEVRVLTKVCNARDGVLTMWLRVGEVNDKGARRLAGSTTKCMKTMGCMIQYSNSLD